MRNIPKPGEVYRHFKGNIYKVVAIATHTETGEMMVVYEPFSGSGKTYARPLEMFLSEVDKEKYPDVTDRYRFTLLDEEDEDAIKSAEQRGLNPLLTQFLDADTYEDKLSRFIAMKGKVSEEVLDYVALSLDITVTAGDIDEKYDKILTNIKALEKYECNRLRQDI